MGKKIDLTNKVFGKLIVIEEYPERTRQGSVQWKCKCECGNIAVISGDNLRRGHTISCGCALVEKAQARLIDLKGQRFGYLTVLEKAHTDANRTVYWKCICDCGTEKIIAGSNLRSGKIKSCGCQMAKKPKDLTGQIFGKLTALNYIHKNGKVYWNCQCECGNMTQVLTNHLLSYHTQSCGCISYSIGEANIANILSANQIEFIQEYKPQELDMLRFDFYLPHYNRLIEFDGKQHYQPCGGSWDNKDNLQCRQARDKIKNNYALEHQIDLIRIPYWERDNITLEMILGNQYIITGE